VRRTRSEAGQAAVELALTLPLLVAIVATVIDLAAMSVARVRLEQTVGAAARVAAASTRPEQAIEILLARSDERGDTTARVDESADGLLLTVTLERTRRAPWSPLSLLGATSLSATATAAIEPVRGP
jgi:uncharacterized membrane protein